MLIKIKRQACIDKYPKIPLRAYNSKKEDYDLFYPETFAGYVLTLPSKSVQGYIKLLGTEIKNLTMNFGFAYLTFMGDFDIPWLYRDHHFKQAKQGQQYLRDNKIGKRFNGALQVDSSELITFIKHLTWMVRTNSLLPYVYFIDPGQNIIGTICQYGNLHINTVNKKAGRRLKELIDKSEFQYLNEICNDSLSKRNLLKERQIKV